MRWLVIRLALLLVFVGCSSKPATGPEKVVWDRDVCARCGMALSDRGHAAQIRGGSKMRAYKFDDIGDALLWLQKQPFAKDPKVELWVQNHQSGEWLTAQAAKYLTGQHTPMGHGFSAQASDGDGAVSFDEMRRRVLVAEMARQEGGS